MTRDGKPLYGQMLHLEGIVCDRVVTVPGQPEMGWFHAGFRKVSEDEARAIESARQTQDASATL